MFHPPQSRILFNAWVGKKHVLLTKNMLFYKSAKQSVRQTDKKLVKKRSKGLKKLAKNGQMRSPLLAPKFKGQSTMKFNLKKILS